MTHTYCWWFRNPKQPPGMYKPCKITGKKRHNINWWVYRISGCHQQYHPWCHGCFSQPSETPWTLEVSQPWRLGICLVATTAMAIPSSASTDSCAGPTFYGALYLSFSHPFYASELVKGVGEEWNKWKGYRSWLAWTNAQKIHTHIYIYIYDIYIWHIYIFCIYVVVIVVGVIIYVVIDTTTWLSRRAKLDQIKISRSALTRKPQFLQFFFGCNSSQNYLEKCADSSGSGITPGWKYLTQLPWIVLCLDP